MRVELLLGVGGHFFPLHVPGCPPAFLRVIPSNGRARIPVTY